METEPETETDQAADGYGDDEERLKCNVFATFHPVTVCPKRVYGPCLPVCVRQREAENPTRTQSEVKIKD